MNFPSTSGVNVAGFLMIGVCLLGGIDGGSEAFGQQIVTPSNTPLVIGGSGLRIGSFTNASAAQAPATSNFKVFGPDGSGNVSLLDVSGLGGGPWTLTGNNARNTNSGNVGIGLTSPLYKLDVGGSLNIPDTSSFRLGGMPFLRKAGASSVYIGPDAGKNSAVGERNVYVGSSAGLNSGAGTDNIFLGYYSGAANQGSYNFFLGTFAGTANTSGSGNTAIGTFAGSTNQTGSNNTAIGTNSSRFSTGNSNIAIGSGAGYGLKSGDGNVVIGANAAFTNNCSYCTFIGSNANSSVDNLTNVNAFGRNAVASVNNSFVIGAPAGTSNALNVGIGVSAPTARLEVKSGASGSSGLKFTDMTSASPGTIVTATRFLTVDANGNVVMGSTNGAREAASFAENWKLDASTRSLSNANEGAVVIGQNLLKLPGSYRLFVQEGILTERVKVALRDTDDWSDKVFAPSYRLRSLNEVDQFIQRNGHLPGVPSATEMVKSGNDLHKTDAVLLEKIEELTLYMIELRKENEKLRKDIDQLKQNQNR
ncbi:MAG: bZIP transcription factor [Siphonobacter aquaeclarae]|jgi:hypothetical protein|nr:bZIP transcription factor [Siphonobacter aquaeclarae]